MVWVWAPDVGSTKFSEWFTVWCCIPTVGICEYALHSSLMTVVPGRMYCWIKGMIEDCCWSWLYFYHEALSTPLSTPPNTQWPSRYRPLLYFCFPNLDSLILTTFPGPPTRHGWSMKYCAHTSRRKLYQSTMVCSAWPVSCMAIDTVAFCDHHYVTSTISCSFNGSQKRNSCLLLKSLIDSLYEGIYIHSIPSFEQSCLMKGTCGSPLLMQAGFFAATST